MQKISKFSGEIKIDESYFGAKKVRKKKGGWSSGQNTADLEFENGKNYIKQIENF